MNCCIAAAAAGCWEGGGMHGAFVAGAAGDEDNDLGSGSEGYYQGDSDAGVVERRLDRAAAAVVGYRRRLHEVAALMMLLVVLVFRFS